MQKIYLISARWDDEAKVWVARSDDVPGLATESGSVEDLDQKLKTLIPELLELNGLATTDRVAFEVLARRFSLADPVAH